LQYPIQLENCTWKEIERAVEEGCTTAIIPCAALEQHGPHLPLNTAVLIAEALAGRVALDLENAFAAPVLRPGISPQHMDFPGTISLGDNTFINLLADTCLSLARHGFRYLVLLPISMHPFAVSTVTSIVQERIFEEGLPAAVLSFGDALQRRRWQQEWLAKELGCTAEQAGGQGGLAETSMLLALRPDLVRMDQVAPGWMGSAEEANAVVLREGMRSLSPSGVAGDPRAASPETGAALLDYLSAEMAREIRTVLLCRR
jgi:creatinine amidohydrolase